MGRPFSNLARGLGFEPRLEVPKTPVLPLDDPRTVYKVRVELPLWSFYCTHISMHYKLKFCDCTIKITGHQPEKIFNRFLYLGLFGAAKKTNEKFLVFW